MPGQSVPDEDDLRTVVVLAQSSKSVEQRQVGVGSGEHREDQPGLATVEVDAGGSRRRLTVPLERWWLSPGVSPRLAPVALTEKRRLDPLTSSKTVQAPRRRAFCLPGPLDLGPALDRRVVAPEGPPGRAPAAPAQAGEDPPHLAAVAGDADPLDHLGHPSQGPQLGGEAVREGVFRQRTLDALPVPLVEPR